jgi:hypothetical protein
MEYTHNSHHESILSLHVMIPPSTPSLIVRKSPSLIVNHLIPPCWWGNDKTEGCCATNCSLRETGNQVFTVLMRTHCPRTPLWNERIYVGPLITQESMFSFVLLEKLVCNFLNSKIGFLFAEAGRESHPFQFGSLNWIWFNGIRYRP